MLGEEPKKLASGGASLLVFCLMLGHALGKSLAEIGELDLDELALWAAWWPQHDPQRLANWRAGVISATVANAAFGSQGGFGPDDFFAPGSIPASAASRMDSGKEMAARMKAWCANVGGEIRQG